MSDRFDLEQQILGCWGITDDLQLFLDRYDSMDEDQRQNFVIGLKEIYSHKFDQCFETFSQCVSTKAL